MKKTLSRHREQSVAIQMGNGLPRQRAKLFSSQGWKTITVFLFGFLFFVGISNARSYPLKEITLNTCSGDECTKALPLISNADYFSYRYNADYRRVYSMLRLGTYFERRDVGMGSHQGVDIATITGTPVYASYEGEVIVADTRGDRGKVVVLKHERNNQILYTTYAHLSRIDVRVGDKVSEGKQLGEVGETGNATGPHLHFQIETNQDNNHPFFPKGCAGTIDEIVNEGNCYDLVRKNTLDPIVFLENTVQLVKANTGTKVGSIYLKDRDIKVSGFLGGFMETNSTVQLTFSKQGNDGGEFLTAPISIQLNPLYLSASPSKIQVLEGERNMFLQSTASTGLTLVKLLYGDSTLLYFPILVNDKEGIAAWKQNTKLMAALEALGLKG